MARKQKGWYGESRRHSLASRGIPSGSNRVSRSMRRSLPNKARMGARFPELRELTKVEVAENAIRDMFLSKQYGEKIPCEDVSVMLNSPRWYSLYGKKELKEAWDSLVKEGFIHRRRRSLAVHGEGDYWIWEMR